MAYFCLKLKMYEFNNCRAMNVMAMTNDAKFEEELTCQLKIDMRNLTNFDLGTQKSQKLEL